MRVTLDVTRIPVALHAMQRALADALRAEADGQADPRVAAALRKVAAAFEVSDPTAELRDDEGSRP